MNAYLVFICGLFLGTFLGLILAACLAMAGRESHQEELLDNYDRGYQAAQRDLAAPGGSHAQAS